jgi:hypothetical protein
MKKLLMIAAILTTPLLAHGDSGLTLYSQGTTNYYQLFPAAGMPADYSMVMPPQICGGSQQVLQVQGISGTQMTMQCAPNGSGNGSSSLGVFLSGIQISSPTAALNLDAAHFLVTLQGFNTSYITLASTQTFSSMTITGQLSFAGNILPQVASAGLNKMLYFNNGVASFGDAPGFAMVDNTLFTTLVSSFNPAGGWYDDFTPPLSSSAAGSFRMTAYRAEHVNLRNSSGAEIGTQASPISIDLETIFGSPLAPLNSVPVHDYGNVDVDVINTPTVAQAGGPWSQNITQVNGVPLVGSSIPVTGNFTTTSSSTTASVTAYQGGVWNINASFTPPAITTVTFNGSAQPFNLTQVGGASFALVSSSLPITGNVTISGITLSSTTSSIASYQGGSWTVGVNNFPATYTVTPGTGSWLIVQSSFGVTGSSVAAFQGGAWTVGVNNFPATYTVTPGTGTWLVIQSSFGVNGSSIAAFQGGSWTMSVSNFPATYTVTPGTGTWLVIQSSFGVNGSSIAAFQGGTWTVQQGGSNWSINLAQVGGSNFSLVGGSLPVAGSLAITLSSATSSVTSYEGGSWSIVNSTVGANLMFNNTAVTAANPLPITNIGLGAQNVQGSISTGTLITINVATGPVLNGGEFWGTNLPSTPTVTSGPYPAYSQVGESGQGINQLDCPAGIEVVVSTVMANGTTEVVVVSSGGAGIAQDIVSGWCVNSSATGETVDLHVNGNGSTPVLHLYCPADDMRPFPLSGHKWPQTISNANITSVQGTGVTSIEINMILCQRKQ